eukprot:GHVT01101088.1.p1 GENE.GHVT01101088.1~~GHVT01101088.1.p1  ORF type:complete len:794 (+),score=197.91 GHVT01101088.1:322-2382(+)
MAALARDRKRGDIALRNEHTWLKACEHRESLGVWLANTTTCFDMMLGTLRASPKRFLALTPVAATPNPSEELQQAKVAVASRFAALAPLRKSIKAAVVDLQSLSRSVLSEVVWLVWLSRQRSAWRLRRLDFHSVDFHATDGDFPHAAAILVRLLSIPSTCWGLEHPKALPTLCTWPVALPPAAPQHVAVAITTGARELEEEELELLEQERKERQQPIIEADTVGPNPNDDDDDNTKRNHRADRQEINAKVLNGKSHGATADRPKETNAPDIASQLPSGNDLRLTYESYAAHFIQHQFHLDVRLTVLLPEEGGVGQDVLRANATRSEVDEGEARNPSEAGNVFESTMRAGGPTFPIDLKKWDERFRRGRNHVAKREANANSNDVDGAKLPTPRPDGKRAAAPLTFNGVWPEVERVGERLSLCADFELRIARWVIVDRAIFYALASQLLALQPATAPTSKSSAWDAPPPAIGSFYKQPINNAHAFFLPRISATCGRISCNSLQVVFHDVPIWRACSNGPPLAAVSLEGSPSSSSSPSGRAPPWPSSSHGPSPPFVLGTVVMDVCHLAATSPVIAALRRQSSACPGGGQAAAAEPAGSSSPAGAARRMETGGGKIDYEPAQSSQADDPMLAATGRLSPAVAAKNVAPNSAEEPRTHVVVRPDLLRALEVIMHCPLHVVRKRFPRTRDTR